MIKFESDPAKTGKPEKTEKAKTAQTTPATSPAAEASPDAGESDGTNAPAKRKGAKTARARKA